MTKTVWKAVEMGVPVEEAKAARIRYLFSTLPALEKDGSPVALHWAKEAQEEINLLMKEEQQLPDGEINNYHVMRAREFPVLELVHLENKKTHAFCHEDRKPSLYYAERIQKMLCPVCNKTFNAIDILMGRDNYSFIDAVKRLNGMV